MQFAECCAGFELYAYTTAASPARKRPDARAMKAIFRVQSQALKAADFKFWRILSHLDILGISRTTRSMFSSSHFIFTVGMLLGQRCCLHAGY